MEKNSKLTPRRINNSFSPENNHHKNNLTRYFLNKPEKSIIKISKNQKKKYIQ